MKRAVVLVHDDRHGIVDPYVVAALESYRKVCDSLAFVTVSARNIPRAVNELVDKTVLRNNVGYDSGSWKTGLQALDHPTDFDEVVCVNASMRGPLFDIGNAMDAAAVQNADYWGIFLSEMQFWSVKSRFFAMRSPMLRSPKFREFWEAAGDNLSSEKVIRRREIVLTDASRRAGHAIAAIYDARVAPPVAWREISDHVSIASPSRPWRLIRKTRP